MFFVKGQRKDQWRSEWGVLGVFTPPPYNLEGYFPPPLEFFLPPPLEKYHDVYQIIGFSWV